MQNKEVVGSAVRVEYIEKEDRLYLVFEITNEKYKQSIKKDWTRDIEFKVVDKQLILEI